MDATLKSVARDTRGKNAARRLRREGLIPAVLYGGEEKESHDTGTRLSVDPKALMRILHSEAGVNSIIALDLPDGGQARVMVKEYQLDPLKHSLLHADFYRFSMDKPITVTVPVILRGEARGVKQQGGLLDFVHREIELECLPADIPEHIDVDVSELMIGQGVRVRDVMADQRWTPVSDPDMLLVHVLGARIEEAPAAEAEAAPTAAEPEVIKKGKGETAKEAG